MWALAEDGAGPFPGDHVVLESLSFIVSWGYQGRPLEVSQPWSIIPAAHRLQGREKKVLPFVRCKRINVIHKISRPYCSTFNFSWHLQIKNLLLCHLCRNHAKLHPSVGRGLLRINAPENLGSRYKPWWILLIGHLSSSSLPGVLNPQLLRTHQQNWVISSFFLFQTKTPLSWVC